MALKLRRSIEGFIEGGISTPFLSSCLMKGRELLVSMFVSARETRGQEERMVVEWLWERFIVGRKCKTWIGLKYFLLIHLYLIHFCWEMRLI